MNDSLYLPRLKTANISAMTRKVITLEFAVPTVLAIGLAILQPIGAVYLKEKYLGRIDQAEAPHSIADSR
jgi:hypothetical protein